MTRKLLIEKQLAAHQRPHGLPANLPILSWNSPTPTPSTTTPTPPTTTPTPSPTTTSFIRLPTLNLLKKTAVAQLRPIIQQAPPDTQLVCWSGSCAENLGSAHPNNWMGTGFRTLLDFTAEIRPELENNGVRLLFLPHARQILSDPPSAVEFIRRQFNLPADIHPTEFPPPSNAPFGLALSPSKLFEPSMVPDRADHLRRIFNLLGPLTEALILEEEYLIESTDEIVPSSTIDPEEATEILDWEILAECLQGNLVSPAVPLILPLGMDQERLLTLCKLGEIPDSAG